MRENHLGEWAIASHGNGTCPREVAYVDYHYYLLDILHSETTNRNFDNISIWTKGNLHFVCWPLNFKKLAEIMIMVRDLCQKKLVSMLLDQWQSGSRQE